MTDSFNGWESQQIPYSHEAEEATIGAVLVNPAAYFDVSAFLEPDDFFILRHKYIWQALGRLVDKGTPVDYLTLTQELRDMDKLADIGGPAYLTQLINSTPTSVHAVIYGKLVESSATRRRLMAAADEIKALALNEELPIGDVTVEAQQRLDDVHPDDREHFLPGSASIEYYDRVQQELKAKVDSGQMVAYPLPPEWIAVRELVPNIYPGDFVVISGLPGSGKSSALEQWAEHTASLGLWTSYTHTEMSTEQILHRRMARHSGLPYHVLASGKMTQLQRDLTVQADTKIEEFSRKVSYCWMPDVRFERLQNQMRRDAVAGVKVFFIDHFQDIQLGSGNENPVREYEAACIWLAAFAEFRKVVVVVASQENDKGSTKWSKKLIEKALTRISIKRKELSSEYSYRVNGVEYRSMPGESDPVSEWMVTKARFGKRGKKRMLNHGIAFQWLDMTAVQKVEPVGYKPNFMDAAMPPERDISLIQ